VSGGTSRDRDILTSRSFLLMCAAGTIVGLVSGAALVGLPLLLISRGFSTGLAAWALGLGGAGQVAGRILYPALNRRLQPRTRTIVVFAGFAVTLAAQAVVPGPVWVLIAIAILTGSVRGLFTLVTATVIAELWGPERYASISGVYNAPIVAAGALAPAIGAGIAALIGGYPALFGMLAAAAIIAAVLVAIVGRPQPAHQLAPTTATNASLEA
jgi:MFS family permease